MRLILSSRQAVGVSCAREFAGHGETFISIAIPQEFARDVDRHAVAVSWRHPECYAAVVVSAGLHSPQANYPQRRQAPECVGVIGFRGFIPKCMAV